MPELIVRDAKHVCLAQWMSLSELMAGDGHFVKKIRECAYVFE